MSMHERGFTLVEMMVVVAIIGVLAAVSLPFYREHVVRSANNACLKEAKAYMELAVANLANNQDAPPYTANSCASINAVPVIADYVANNPVGFSVGPSGDRDTQCEAGSSTCELQ